MALLDLTTVIKGKNTLVVSCVECHVTNHAEEGVFVYTSLANAINKERFLENVEYYVVHKQCTQVILAGHLHCHALKYVRSGSLDNSNLSSIKTYLKDLEADNYVALVDKNIQERFIAELNIIKQGELLMQFNFIANKVRLGELLITGVIYDQKNNLMETIFFNGFTVNTLLKLN